MKRERAIVNCSSASDEKGLPLTLEVRYPEFTPAEQQEYDERQVTVAAETSARTAAQQQRAADLDLLRSDGVLGGLKVLNGNHAAAIYRLLNGS